MEHITLHHYSREYRQVLDTKYAGTNLSQFIGEDVKRLRARDSIKQRLYFYAPPAGASTPNKNSIKELDGVLHVCEVPKHVLYDYRIDKLRLKAQHKDWSDEQWLNWTEKVATSHGYLGTYNPTAFEDGNGLVILLGHLVLIPNDKGVFTLSN